MSLKDPIGAKAPASIDGAPASLDDAATAAARLLARSGQPLIAGLGADIAGARAAIALAARLGGVIEHTHSPALLRDLDSMRETGVMLMTPTEARLRADLVLLVGDGLIETWPALNERLLAPPARPEGVDVKRRIIWLAPAIGARIRGFEGDIEIWGAGRGATLAANLAALRARAKGRPVARSGLPLSAIELDRDGRHSRAVWRRGLDGGESRRARNRDDQWPRARPERHDAVLDIAARSAGQWRGRARGLRMDDGIPHANRVRRRRAHP